MSIKTIVLELVYFINIDFLDVTIEVLENCSREFTIEKGKLNFYG